MFDFIDIFKRKPKGFMEGPKYFTFKSSSCLSSLLKLYRQ